MPYLYNQQSFCRSNDIQLGFLRDVEAPGRRNWPERSRQDLVVHLEFEDSSGQDAMGHDKSSNCNQGRACLRALRLEEFHMHRVYSAVGNLQ